MAPKRLLNSSLRLSTRSLVDEDEDEIEDEDEDEEGLGRSFPTSSERFCSSDDSAAWRSMADSSCFSRIASCLVFSSSCLCLSEELEDVGEGRSAHTYLSPSR